MVPWWSGLTRPTQDRVPSGAQVRILPVLNGPIAQMARAPFLYSGCRGFEPHWDY